MPTPRDPFEVPPDPAVFGELTLPMQVLPLEAGFTWWADSFALFKQDWLTWIGTVLGFLVISGVVLAVPLVGAVALHIVQTIMLGGLVLGCREADSGGRFRFVSLFAAFRAPYLVPLTVMACTILVAFIAFFLVLGMGLGMLGLAFSISRVLTPNTDNLPLLVTLLMIIVVTTSVVGMFYWFAPALIVFYRVGPIDALRLSFIASLRNIAPMLGYGIVFVMVLLAGVLTLGLAFLVIAPVIIASIYISTRSVFGLVPSAARV